MVNLNGPSILTVLKHEQIPNDSLAGYACRSEGGHKMEVEAVIGGTGAQTINVFQFTGTLRVLDQYAMITRVGTLTNFTGMYADVWDGTNSVLLTDNTPGASLSGAPVGTYFTKNMDETQPYTVLMSDEVRVDEPDAGDKKVSQPFTANPKNGATNYIRFHYNTTDNPVDFDMTIYFIYELLN